MEKYPDIATGFTKRKKEEVKSIWKGIEKKVNSFGPPVKSVYEWKKVWIDKKKYVRKKMAENLKFKNATGGGPCKEYTFSTSEEAIRNICAMSESVEGCSNANRFGLPSCGKKRKVDSFDDAEKENIATVSLQNAQRQSQENVASVSRQTSQRQPQDHQKYKELDESALMDLLDSNDEHEQPNDSNEDLDDIANNSARKSFSKGQKKIKSTANLLEKELLLQRELCDKLGEAISKFEKHHTEMEISVKKVYRSIDRLSDQQKMLVQQKKRHNDEMENLKRHEIQEAERHNMQMENFKEREIETKLKIKQRLLDIEEEKLQTHHNKKQ